MEPDYEIYNSTFSEFEEDYSYSWPHIVMNIVQGPALVIGLLANAFLLFLFIVRPRLRTPANFLLLQRAIADIFVQVPFPFFIYFRVVGFDQLGVHLCRSFSFSIHFGVVSSLLLLMGLAMHHYQASDPKNFPRAYRIKTIRAVSILAWLLALTAGLAGCFLTHKSTTYCDLAPLYNHRSLGRVVAQLFTALIAPLVVLWVFVSMSSSPRPPRDEGEIRDEGDEAINESPNHRLLLALVCVFTVLHGIYWFFMVLIFIHYSFELSIISSMTSSLSLYSEPLNAILVMWLLKDVRQEVIALLLPQRYRRTTHALPLQ